MPTIPVNKGGTGRTTLTSGYYIKGNGTAAVTMSSPATVKSDLGITSLETEIEDLKTSVSEGKALVAEAVTDKGVQTASDATFQEIASNIREIVSLTSVSKEVVASFDSSGQVQKVFTGEKLYCMQDDCPRYMHSTDLSGFASSTTTRCSVEQAIQIDETTAIVFYITESEYDGNRDSVQIQCAIIEYDGSAEHKIKAINRYNIISADFTNDNPNITYFCIVHNKLNDVLIALVFPRQIAFVSYNGSAVTSSSVDSTVGYDGGTILPLDDNKVLFIKTLSDRFNATIISYNNGTVSTTNTVTTYINEDNIDELSVPIPTAVNTEFLFSCIDNRNSINKFKLTINSSTNPTTLAVSTYSGTLEYIGNHDIYYKTKSGSTTHIYECYLNAGNSTDYGYFPDDGITFIHATSSGSITIKTLLWEDACGFTPRSAIEVHAVKTAADGVYLVTACNMLNRYASTNSNSLTGQFIYYWQMKIDVVNNTVEMIKYPELLTTSMATGYLYMLAFDNFIEFTFESSDLTYTVSTLDADQYTIDDIIPISNSNSRMVFGRIFNAVALEDGEYPNTVRVAVLN